MILSSVQYYTTHSIICQGDFEKNISLSDGKDAKNRGIPILSGRYLCSEVLEGGDFFQEDTPHIYSI
jgi:hypothetical protein